MTLKFLPALVPLLLAGWSRSVSAAEPQVSVELHKAVTDGDVARVQLLLTNTQPAKEVLDSLTIEAAYLGQAPIIHLLLQRGASPNASSDSGWSALMAASRAGRTEAVRLLLDHGADPRAVNRAKTSSPLLVASESGSVDVVDMLVARQADVNQVLEPGQTPLLVATKNGRVAIVRRLLKFGARIDSEDNHGNTALLLAAETGDGAIVAQLLTCHANSQIRNANGETALLVAAKSGHSTAAQLLLGPRTGINVPDNNGLTPLMCAAMTGDEPLVRALLSFGADPNATNKLGRSAFDLSQNVAISEMLTNKPAAIKLPQTAASPGPSQLQTLTSPKNYDADLQEALVLAAREGNVGKVTELLRSGVPPSATNRFGWPALVVAAANGRAAVVRALLQNGADVDAQGRRQWTALLEAAKGGHLEIVRLLVESGADIHEATSQGAKPIDVAASSRHQDVVDYLESRGTKPGVPGVLNQAVYQANFPTLRVLLEDPDCAPLYRPFVSPALLVAAKYGQVEAAKFLISKGADVNYADQHPRDSSEYGRTPLLTVLGHRTSADGGIGYPEMLKVLIAAGADPNQTDKMGESPLAAARKIKDPALREQIIEQLRRAGVKE